MSTKPPSTADPWRNDNTGFTRQATVFTTRGTRSTGGNLEKGTGAWNRVKKHDRNWVTVAPIPHSAVLSGYAHLLVAAVSRPGRACRRANVLHGGPASGRLSTAESAS